MLLLELVAFDSQVKQNQSLIKGKKSGFQFEPFMGSVTYVIQPMILNYFYLYRDYHSHH